MNEYINVPNKILMDNKLNNKTKNILIQIFV